MSGKNDARRSAKAGGTKDERKPKSQQTAPKRTGKNTRAENARKREAQAAKPGRRG